MAYERFLWFDEQIRQGKYPNAGKLCEQFEISSKTAHRAIEFMRDRLRAPLEYIARKRGYAYADEAYELPRLWLSQEELTALLLSARLATMLPDNGLKQSIDNLLDELLNAQSLSQRISIQDLKQRISLKNAIYTNTTGATFRLVLEALLGDGALEIEYYSPHSGNFTERTIVPLHMVCYMGAWHVIAHCCMRGELRDFALGRIKNIRSASRPQDITFSPSLICEHLNNSFGIMTGEALANVRLRFDSNAARLISEQIWHPEQWTEHLSDGVILNFPVADLAEIKREILKFGAGVEVLAPNELRQAVSDEIAGMQKIYVSGHHMTEFGC